MSKKKYWEDVYYSQPTNNELVGNAKLTAEKAAKRGKTLNPVIITGNKIAKSWWGIAWCNNLEKYADYESRLSRGKRYVKLGSVVDLQIDKGKINARVQGSRKTPYKVEIRISPLSEKQMENITAKCGLKVENLNKLVSGDFPAELKDVFIGEDGLFPKPREISFNCSCPDWALMCKHVAAVLYGVGARLDEDPLLFFSLRGIDTNRFVDVVIANRTEMMLENINKPSKRILSDVDLSEVFGVL
ncbi:MAG: SWIM zinc finger family protein [Firmicutes bacterium]|nr:SWIM zinc finger family protein [Bacillota bacterium]